MIISQIQEYDNGIQSYNSASQSMDGLSNSHNFSTPSDNQAKDSLPSGQIITGQVIESKDDTVVLKLEDNKLVTAKLEGAIDILKGQTLSFEVSNSQGITSLRPLYANMDVSSSVSSALNSAGIQLNSRNINMVQAMMNEGMPVNRNALYSMLKDVNSFPNADPATIVQLNKLSLPINELNINQLENYKNFEYQIIGDVKDLSDELSIFATGAAFRDEGTDELLEVLSLIREGNVDWEEISKSGNEANALGEEKTDDLLKNEVANNVVAEDSGNDIFARLKQLMENSQGKDDITTTNDKEYTNSFQNDENKIADLLKLSGMPEDKVIEYKAGNLSSSEVIDFVKYSIANNLDNNGIITNSALKDLIGSEDFRSMIKESLIEEWTLKPEEVADDKKVEELYRRLNEQSLKAIQLLENSGKESGLAMKSAQNINDNVNFMNQLNHMMPYVQLPLKMAQRNTHGDLYVYTKNRNLIGKDGNISALLHLDMDNLGPMDVHVAMTGNKVNTHFYMQDVKTLEFIEENIHLLDERLAKKGYNMHTSVTTKTTEKESPVQEFLKSSSKEGMTKVPVSKLSFDVRA